jgi:hypothetical protein
VAKGIYRIPDGQVMVDYGRRRAPVSRAQYKANGYQPSYEKLEAKLRSARGSPDGIDRRRRSMYPKLRNAHRDRAQPSDNDPSRGSSPTTDWRSGAGALGPRFHPLSALFLLTDRDKAFMRRGRAAGRMQP